MRKLNQNISVLKIEKEAIVYANKLIADVQGKCEVECYSTSETFFGKWGGEHLSSIERLSSDVGLEYNTLRNLLPCDVGGEGERVSTENADRMYGATRKLVNHYVGISIEGGFPGLKAINRRAFSGRGHNSPATGRFTHAYEAFQFMNIHKMEKMIWAVKESAMRKHGIKVSHETALEAAGVAGVNVSKAATVAFALSLGFSPTSYRQAREIVVAYLTAQTKDDIKIIDGVESFGHTKVFEKGNIKGYSCYIRLVWNRQPYYTRGYVIIHHIEGAYHMQGNVMKTALVRALEAFKERKAMRIANL